MAESLGRFLEQFFSPQVIVFIISLLPILELRGGLVVAKLLGLPWMQAYIISIIGNALPVPFIIYLIRHVLEFLKHHGPIKKLATKMEEKGHKGGMILKEKYPRSLYLGLFLFVAIPLPGTGAWTGSLIASYLDLDKKKSIITIFAGIIGASIIMSILAYFVPGMFGI